MSADEANAVNQVLTSIKRIANLQEQKAEIEKVTMQLASACSDGKLDVSMFNELSPTLQALLERTANDTHNSYNNLKTGLKELGFDINKIQEDTKDATIS